MHLDIKIHRITNAQVLINVKKVEMKNDALQMHNFYEMSLAAVVDKNWIPVDGGWVLVEGKLIPVDTNSYPDVRRLLPVDKKFLPDAKKLIRM